jgi:heme exporter protein CcmD
VSDPHIGFVVAAYAIAAIVLVGMVVVVFADYRAQQKALKRLESREGQAEP